MGGMGFKSCFLIKTKGSPFGGRFFYLNGRFGRENGFEHAKDSLHQNQIKWGDLGSTLCFTGTATEGHPTYAHTGPSATIASKNRFEPRGILCRDAGGAARSQARGVIRSIATGLRIEIDDDVNVGYLVYSHPGCR